MHYLLKLLATIALLSASATFARGQEPIAMKRAAPGFPGVEAWINSKPLTLKELRGKVVVLHFWAFG